MNSLPSSGLSMLLANSSLTIVLFCASDVDILFRRSRLRLCSEQGVKYKQAFELHTDLAILRAVSGEDEDWCIQYETKIQRKKICRECMRLISPVGASKECRTRRA